MHFEGKYELLIIRNKYLKNALQLTEKIANKAQPLFSKALTEKLGYKEKQKENKEIAKEQTSQSQPPPIDDDGEILKAEKQQKDENLKPDKLQKLSEFEKQYKTSLFEKARMSLQENDYYGIVEVATELGIEPPPPTKKQIDLMKKTNQELENKIKELENSVLWSWYHGDEQVKEMLLSKYVERLRKMYPGS